MAENWIYKEVYLLAASILNDKMRYFMRLFLVLIITLFVADILAQTNPNHVYVKGYYRKDGTYVEPHFRTAPNNTNNDNFSTRGNVNPYTGEPGYVSPDGVFFNPKVGFYPNQPNYFSNREQEFRLTDTGYLLHKVNYEKIGLSKDRLTSISRGTERVGIAIHQKRNKWTIYDDNYNNIGSIRKGSVYTRFTVRDEHGNLTNRKFRLLPVFTSIAALSFVSIAGGVWISDYLYYR